MAVRAKLENDLTMAPSTMSLLVPVVLLRRLGLGMEFNVSMDLSDLMARGG